MTKRDRSEFIGYLRQCTDRQVQGVWEKERQARRRAYQSLAELEAARRGITLTR